MDTWCVSTFCLLWIMLLWIHFWGDKSFYFSPLRLWKRDFMAGSHSSSMSDLLKNNWTGFFFFFLKLAIWFYIPTSNIRGLEFLHVLITFGTTGLFDASRFGECEVVCRYSFDLLAFFQMTNDARPLPHSWTLPLPCDCWDSEIFWEKKKIYWEPLPMSRFWSLHFESVIVSSVSPGDVLIYFFARLCSTFKRKLDFYPLREIQQCFETLSTQKSHTAI